MTENELPQIIRLEETDSTNRYLRERLRQSPLPELSTVIARSQTAGRGQAENRWESEPGQNLTFSLVLYPRFIPITEQFIISQITALSIKQTLDLHTPDISIKWPNDIYWQEKKICGTLIENDLAGAEIYLSVIGIGLNINQEAFTSDAPNPISLRQITGETYDLQAVFNEFMHHFRNHYLRLLQEEKQEIRQEYRAALYRGTGYHPYSDAEGTFEACIQEIEPTGHLILTTREGTKKRYAFKEVAFL